MNMRILNAAQKRPSDNIVKNMQFNDLRGFVCFIPSVIVGEPIVIMYSSCSGVFMIDGIQHKGQVDLSRSKQKKKTEILRNKLMNAKSQNQFIPGFIIIGEPKNGVYLLKSKQ